ncbi:hypothetical protein [Rathayibacter rathayi]|uniref:hypothetical protein n=1 Tax=Rathayibacter rathayi TaxID=33887 RepID=UPI0011B0ED5F|nr:hypothetical protein [Rathayibacter rathayi]
MAAVIGCSIVSLTESAHAQEAATDKAIALRVGQDSHINTTTGEALSVLSDSNEAGERVVFAEGGGGWPVKVVIQSFPHSASTAPGSPEASTSLTTDAPQLVVERRVSTEISTDPSNWTITSSYATTPTTASFMWDEAQAGFSATIDGTGRQVSAGEPIVFEGLEPGSSHTVVLTGSIRRSGEAVVESEKTFSIRTLRDKSRIESGEDFNPLSSRASANSYQPYSTAYVHKTFIPDATVDGSMCNWADSSYRFKGDDRGYRMPSADTPYGERDYRTMMFVNVNWDNPAPYTVVTAKDVGESVTQRDGVTTHASYASSDDMKFEEIESGGAYAQVRLNHSASNPHCKILDENYGGSIRYNEMVRFYRSGIVEVVGYRRAAPAHEMYARFSDSAGIEAWTTVSQWENQGFHCLIEAACALDNYAISEEY